MFRKVGGQKNDNARTMGRGGGVRRKKAGVILSIIFPRPSHIVVSFDVLLDLFSFCAAVACVASVSVRFPSKERGTIVKDRAKNQKWCLKKVQPKPKIPFLGLILLRNHTETFVTQASAASSLTLRPGFNYEPQSKSKSTPKNHVPALRQ